jgi:hypothetical protein
MSEPTYIQNPFSEIFTKSMNPCGEACDLKARKEDAVGWIKTWVNDKTGGRLTLGGDGGMDIVYNIGMTNSKTCYAHCSIGAKIDTQDKRRTRCRIMTPANPEACDQTIISVVDESPTASGVNWTLGREASNREEFREIRSFLSEFQDCKTGDGFVNNTLRGKKSENVEVGFLLGRKKFGSCVIRADQQGRDARDRSNTKVSTFRQPSGLDALLFATPNPRYGGSFNESQCKEVLEIQQKLCIQKFNDRLNESIDPIGIQSLKACGDSISCENKKIRDACLGITNWDRAEPDVLKDEDDKFGVPDMMRHCVIPAGAQTGITRTDAGTTLEAVEQLASSLPTQIAATTLFGQQNPDSKIDTRSTNCLSRCQTQTGGSENFCQTACGPLLLNESIPDNFEGVEFERPESS